MNTIIPGAQIGAFKTISLSIGQAKKANRDGKISKFLVIGIKNKKSLLGKKQNVILFDDDLSPEIFTVLQKYATPSTDPNHQGDLMSILQTSKLDQNLLKIQILGVSCSNSLADALRNTSLLKARAMQTMWTEHQLLTAIISLSSVAQSQSLYRLTSLTQMA